MQTLCEREVLTQQNDADRLELMTLLEAPSKIQSHAAEVVQSCVDLQATIDELISSAMTQWDLERLSPVERNVMRVALMEILEGKTPPRVAIDEAIEIGRAFGGADSPRFINGVLDEAWRKIREQTGQG
ncbi:MAG: transcription antitermination factor NusB [Planctomycetes bacterium]|nr:transcription antitermination factor NusB [Planctomycetota bacterium]